MSIRVTIKNEEPEGAASTLAVEVVSVGDDDDRTQVLQLAAQQSLTVTVAANQFLMMDNALKSTEQGA